MTDFQKYISRYLDLIPATEVLAALQSSKFSTLQVFEALSDTDAEFKYADGKWSIKEVLQHVIDCERIFQYRALAIARKECTNLPGFDEESYAVNAGAALRPLQDLISEYKTVRESGILLFKSFSQEMLDTIGTANGNCIAVQTIGKLISGHNVHHLNIIKERYINKNFSNV